MNARDLLDALRQRRIELHMEGDRLRYRAPEGALSPDLKDALKRHKSEVKAILQQATTAPDSPRGSPDGGGAASPNTLEAELVLEKKHLADKIRTCHDPDLRRRLENLHQEEPRNLAAALDWQDRLLALEEAWRSNQAMFETLRETWDQVEAERLLAHLREELARIERQKCRGRFPPELANVVADGLGIADGCVRNHEQEAARGWDAMQLLRGIVSSLLSVARGDRRSPTPTTLAVPGK